MSDAGRPPLDTPPAALSDSPVQQDVGEEGRSAARSFLSGLAEFLRLLVVALVLAFVIKSLLLQAFFIPSESMLETLQVSDRVLVEKVSYRFRDPQRGEIIVFRRPGLEAEGFSLLETGRSFLEGIGLSKPDADRDLIKRVIGLPGETVEVIEGVVHINGMPLTEPYAGPEIRDFPPVVVPDDEYYMLGDNRGNSLDSRFTLGTIPKENIVGRSFVILWPPGDATFALDHDYPGVGETPVPS
ncbi:N/A [soil metagenome]